MSRTVEPLNLGRGGNFSMSACHSARFVLVYFIVSAACEIALASASDQQDRAWCHWPSPPGSPCALHPAIIKRSQGSSRRPATSTRPRAKAM